MQAEKPEITTKEKILAFKKGKNVRLAFSSKEKVNNLMTNLKSKSNLPNAVIKNEILKVATVKPTTNDIARYTELHDFYSLYNYEQDLVNNGYDAEWQDISTNTTSDNDTYDLIPDESISQILNADMEIEVDNKIYKVTEYGTFVIEPANYNNAIAYINSLDNQNIILTPNDRILPGETALGDDYYQVATGITRFDTYKDFESTEYSTPYIPPSMPNNSQTSNPMDITLPSFISNNNVKYVNYTNDKVFYNFSSDRRMRADFHDYDFIAVKTATLEIAFQKKGFLGIWAKTNAEELGININYLHYIRQVSEFNDNYKDLIPNQFYSYPERILVSSNYAGSTIRYIPREPYTAQTDLIEYIIKNKNSSLVNCSSIQIPLIRPRGYSEGLKPYIYTPGATLKVNILTYAKYNNTWKSIYYHSSESNPL